MKTLDPATSVSAQHGQAPHVVSGPVHDGEPTSWQHYLTASADHLTGPTEFGSKGSGGLSLPLRDQSWLWPPVTDPHLVEELLCVLLGHGFSDQQAATTCRSFFTLTSEYQLLATIYDQAPARDDPVQGVPTVDRLAPLLRGDGSREGFLMSIQTLIDTTEHELATTKQTPKNNLPSPALTPAHSFDLGPELNREASLKSSLALPPTVPRLLPQAMPSPAAAVPQRPEGPSPSLVTMQDLLQRACGMNDQGVVGLGVQEFDDLRSWIRVLPDPRILIRRNDKTRTRCVEISAPHRKPAIQGPITITWCTHDPHHPLWDTLLHGQDLTAGTEEEISAHQLLATLDRLRLAQPGT